MVDALTVRAGKATMAPLHPFIPIPGVIRVALEGDQAGRPFANVFHAMYTGGPPTATQLAAWAGTWYTGVTATLAGIAHTTVTYEQVQVTDLSAITAAQVIQAASVPGGLAGDTIPSNSCGLVNYNSSFRYRGGHPRTYYVCGVQASLLTANTWTTAFQGNLSDAAQSVTDAFALAEGGFVVTQQCAVSYISADVHRVTPVVMPITTVTASAGIATMRRRMRK